jgi:hypothetical protein
MFESISFKGVDLLFYLPVKVANNLFDTLVKPIMTYNSEVTYLDTFISLYKAKKRASTNDKEVDLFNFIDKAPIENLHLSFCFWSNFESLLFIKFP